MLQDGLINRRVCYGDTANMIRAAVAVLICNHPYGCKRQTPQSLGSEPLIMFVPQRLPGTSREQSLSIVGTFWAAKRPGMPQKYSRNVPGVLPGAPRGSKIIKGPNPRFSGCLPLTTLRQGKGCDPVRTARPPRPTAIYMQAYYEGILEHSSKPSWLRKL
jgi:hypothetical protein